MRHCWRNIPIAPAMAEGYLRDYNSRMGSRCLVLLVQMASAATHSQTTTSPSRAATAGGGPVWVFNFPKTPLEIRADSKNLQLETKSKAKIKSYRLGCVRESAKKNVILVYRMASEETEIAPVKPWGIMDFPFAMGTSPECERKSARLGVWKTEFQDERVWRASAKLQED